MSLGCQNLNDLVVIKTFGSQFADAPFHFGITRQRDQAVDRHHDDQLGRRPTTPHNAHVSLVGRTTTHVALFDETTPLHTALFSPHCSLLPLHSTLHDK